MLLYHARFFERSDEIFFPQLCSQIKIRLIIAFLAYLLYQDVNVIVVGWGILASDTYPVAAKNTRLVGEYLGHFLEFLNRDSNLEYKDVHISGHSLGSYVAGFAGAYHDGRIGRITGRASDHTQLRFIF